MYSKFWDYLVRLVIIALAAGSTFPTNFTVRVIMMFAAFILFELRDELAKNRDKKSKPIDQV